MLKYEIILYILEIIGLFSNIFLILCLYRSSRRRNRNNNRTRSATYHADTGRITTNNNSNSNSRSSQRNRSNTNHLTNHEAGQILLAQRLGLIQHLPLIVYEGNKKKKKNTTNNNNEIKTDDNDEISLIGLKGENSFIIYK